MSRELLYAIIGCAAALFVLLLMIRPTRTLLRYVLQTVCGCALLVLANFAGQAVGITVGVNLLNACLIGLLGIPGFGAVLALGWIFP